MIERLKGRWTMIDDVQTMRARLDRLETLVGVAYGAAGSIRPALENAVLQQDIDQMRQEVTAVLNFLRDNDPART